MTSIDTSAEGVENEICTPIIAYVASGRMLSEYRLVKIIDTARALAAERDALRKDVAEARNAALEELRKTLVQRANIYHDNGFRDKAFGFAESIEELEALKSTPIGGDNNG